MAASIFALIFAATAFSGQSELPPKPAPSTTGLEAYAKPQRLVVLPDGRQLNLYCTGNGSPTVIFESAWAASSIQWYEIQPRVAQITRTCSYDRAGLGFSEQGRLPRTAGAAADDLAALLNAADEKSPYILVAHSLGGMNARVFAARNRQSMVGLLLIDPSSPHQNQLMDAISPTAAKMRAESERAYATCSKNIVAGSLDPSDAKARTCVPGDSKSMPAEMNAARRARFTSAAYQQTATSELLSQDLSSAEVDATGSYGDLPLIVLTAGKTMAGQGSTEAESTTMARTWWELHEDAAKLSTRGSHRMLKDNGHMVPRENPELIVQLIGELVATARRSSS